MEFQKFADTYVVRLDKGEEVNECRIGATGEVVVRTLPGTVERLLDEKVTGLNLFKFV